MAEKLHQQNLNNVVALKKSVAMITVDDIPVWIREILGAPSSR